MVPAAPLALLPVNLDDIVAAGRRIASGVVRTPSAVSRTLSQMLGATVVVKFENLQFTASYKERGALNRLLALDADERSRGVVAMSAGNHAQGVAYHASRLGVPATIVMPAFTPAVKVARTRVLGAKVVLYGDDLKDAGQEARRREVEEGLTFVHPYDDLLVIAGQGTVALELLADHPELDTVIVQIGGGGLIAGMAVAIDALAPSVEIVGIQSDHYPAMAAALGQVVGTCGGGTIAEGIAVDRPGSNTLKIVQALVDDVLLVGETDLEVAIGMLVEVEKVVAEGAGAAGLAGLAAHRERFAGRTVGLVLTGGNIDSRLLASVLMRGLVRMGRLVTLQIEVDDRPGALAELTRIVAAEGGNIIEVRHSRLFAELSVRSAQVELVVELAESVQISVVMTRLRAAGFAVEQLHLYR
ncbi:MAG: threonine ammonia-lyase [Acidimicrobiales bacterium]